MNLFDIQRQNNLKKDSPLAERLKPKSLDDYVGQEHILASGKLLWRAIKADSITSIILYGPPGTGKTSLAKVIANTTKSTFVQLNAVTSGIKELREVVEEAKNGLGMYNKKTILFLDEIHRFNKAQQDALLPHVEDGTLVLIGATTENPYFEVNNALISRSMLFQLNPLKASDIEKIIRKAIKDSENGIGIYNVQMSDEAISFLSDISNGDARVALNTLELAVLSTEKNNTGSIIIDLDDIKECVQKKNMNYDRNGDYHYDVISAFIKSMRGSDPDAAVHYLARMIYSGEDPVFIARRIVIAASEDVGNADPMALIVANNAAQAVHLIGMPEARIILSQAAIYVACAPKSNASYNAIDDALADIEKVNTGSVPNHLKNKGGSNYLYPHVYPNHYVVQQYLPNEIKDKKYYILSDNGYEKQIKENLNIVKGGEKNE